ncbi:DUF4170 domain-containing protein [Radicibacter daui]|uniref:DUF4170 domain-containing protein n=1 Tax=Radicibacter daui TaxID=3064829 RepID=UPI004046FD52
MFDGMTAERLMEEPAIRTPRLVGPAAVAAPALMAEGRRFWVIGGRYEDTGFTRLESAGPAAEGPFFSYEAARAVWTRLMAEAGGDACLRYTIAEEGGRGRG